MRFLVLWLHRVLLLDKILSECLLVRYRQCTERLNKEHEGCRWPTCGSQSRDKCILSAGLMFAMRFCHLHHANALFSQIHCFTAICSVLILSWGGCCHGNTDVAGECFPWACWSHFDKEDLGIIRCHIIFRHTHQFCLLSQGVLHIHKTRDDIMNHRGNAVLTKSRLYGYDASNYMWVSNNAIRFGACAELPH